ncbi:MAG: hypothetical protein HC788_01850 [Sphingopyxis sp.]|nr:hypothetical protein [Sphingopyxis sp.]
MSRHKRLALAIMFAIVFFYSIFFLLIGRWMIVQFLAPLALVALLIIWALPERDTIPDKWVERLFFAFLAAVMFWPDYLALTLPGMPWITAVRLIGTPMVLLFIICLSQSSAFRAEIKRNLGGGPWIVRLLLVYVGLSFISIGFSDAPGTSANLFVVAMVNWVAIFFIATWVFSRPENVTRLVSFFWVAVLVWFVLATIEWRNSQLPWANYIPSFLKVDDELSQRILAGSARKASGEYRVQGKFTTSLGLAEFMALVTPFMIHLVVEGRTLLVRFAAMITLPAIMAIIFYTDSRLGIIGFLLAVMLYLLAWGLRRWRTDRKSLMGPALTLSYPAIFVAFVAATFVVGRLRRMVWGGGAESASTQAREQQIDMGLVEIMNQPWGFGFGRAAEALASAARSGC